MINEDKPVNNYDNYADEMLRRIVECVQEQLKKNSPRIESATVTRVNEDGTVNITLPREDNSEFTRIQNQTPFELVAGDSVEILLKKGTFNNCWIIAKHGATNRFEVTNNGLTN